MNNEIWRPIFGYENYIISNYGKIKSLERKILHNRNGKTFIRNVKEKYIKLYLSSKGYLRIRLYKNSNSQQFLVHKLVAETFLNKQEFKSMPSEDRTLINLDDLEVNHKDENKQNNCVNNLEWCTRLYNINYGNGIEKSRIKKYKPIIQYDLNNNIIKFWNSIMEASKELNINFRNISNCCRGYRKTAGGYIWRYAN